jgi:hypothetical protein
LLDLCLLRGGFILSVEKNIAISLLKLTQKGSALIETINMDTHLTSTTSKKLLQKMQNENLVYLNGDSVEVNSASRLKLAIKAATLGADIERISDLLGWQEFEEIASLALKNNGCTAKKNVHFTNKGRRWEIDVVGCSKPLVVCIDCKHWQRAITPSALKKMVDAQIERTEAFADSLPNPKLRVDCALWEKAKFIPVVLSLVPCAYKFYYQVPIGPILQLQDFITLLPAYVHELKFILKKFDKLSHDL